MYDQNQSEGTYQYAAPIKRFAAAFIDQIVLGAILVPLNLLLSVIVGASMQGKDPTSIQYVATVIYYSVAIPVVWL